jgi:hypothetical protein
VLHQARAGHGAVAVTEAPAGQGKTALLRAFRARALTDGTRVLAATGAAFERDFAFGLVRQSSSRCATTARPRAVSYSLVPPCSLARSSMRTSTSRRRRTSPTPACTGCTG